jgi:hypothetical protein
MHRVGFRCISAAIERRRLQSSSFWRCPISIVHTILVKPDAVLLSQQSQSIKEFEMSLMPMSDYSRFFQ